jgi:hypothetical protein
MTDHEDIDGLAAEYALGTLNAAERRQVNARRQADASLSAAIDAWERRLAPLNDTASGVTPPAHLLDAILSRISNPVARQSQVAPLHRHPRRRWALVAEASALAASLVLAIAWSLTQQPLPEGHSKLDCGKLYKDFWQKRDPQSYARMSSEQLAGVSRMVLRAYDACQAGDEQDARALLARLRERSGIQSPKGGSLSG